MNGVVEQASEEELADACASRRSHGPLHVPPHGGCLACLFKLRSAGLVEPGHRVVVVSTANGLKFTEFKLAYHERRLPGIDARRRERAHLHGARCRCASRHAIAEMG